MTRFFTAFVPLLALAGKLALAQFVEQPTDLTTKQGFQDATVRFKEVPEGICETTKGVKSYSGFVDISENRHVFFWFFEARNQDPETAPLTMWLNGGPGSSSMIGLFQELGPCGVKDGELYSNPYAWNNVSNMLFVDEPVTVGLSYSKPVPAYVNTAFSTRTAVLSNNTCPEYAQIQGTCGTYSLPQSNLVPNSTEGAAPFVWKTLQSWMKVFPQYSANGFHIATESYGGHYGPVFSRYILDQNAKDIEGAKKIDLKSLTLNNGWIDPAIHYPAYYNITQDNPFEIDFYNETTTQEIYHAAFGPGNCVDRLKACKETGTDQVCYEADNFCAEYLEDPFDIITGRDEYDVRELTPDPFPYGEYVAYLNNATVQKAIGAHTNYTESSTLVGDAFEVTGDDARESNTIEDIKHLLANDVAVTLWAGDADFNCNWLGSQLVSDVINHNGYSKSGYTALKTPDGIKHGEVRQSGLFSFSRIYKAGHEIPFYQPEAALHVFNRSIHNHDIATGHVALTSLSDYKTHGPKESTFKEGNSTVQYDVLPANATYDPKTGAPMSVMQARAAQQELAFLHLRASERRKANAVKKAAKKAKRRNASYY